MITLLTVVACKKLKTSKTATNQESPEDFSDYEDLNTDTDFSKSDRMQNGQPEKAESTDNDPIYSLIDDARLSESKAPSSPSRSSVEPYSVPMVEADLNKKSNHYESVADPVRASNTAEQCKKKPLRNLESYTSGVDAEDYVEMKEVVQ